MSPVHRAWWLAPELAAVIALAIPLLTGASATPSPAELRAQLTDRVVAALESASPAEHHVHGHEVAGDDRVACVAEVYGTEPADADRVARVRTVYAYFLCAAGPPGKEFRFAQFAGGPVAVRLSDPPTVQFVRSGAGYPDRVRALLPDQYEDTALTGGFRDQAVPDGLRARFEARFSPPAGR